MKRQNGAALIVVLSLLTVSLMVGMSSIQSSQIDERLAGNYRAQSDAQMGAEEAASAGWYNPSLSSDDFVETSLSLFDGLGWGAFTTNSNFSGFSLLSGGCADVDCYYRYVEYDDRYFIVSMGGVDNGAIAVSLPVFVEVFSGGDGIISGVDGALTCVGYECQFFAKTPPTIVSGKDHLASVNVQKPNEGINPDGFDRAAYVVPEGAVENVDLGKAAVVGERVSTVASYDAYVGDLDESVRLSESWAGDEGAKSRIEGNIDKLIALGESGDEAVTYWNEGSEGEFSMPSSGIVVVDGVDLIMDVPGNFEFSGLIVVNDGSFDLRPANGSGRVSVLGAIIARDATVDMQNGNPSLLYSSEVLCNLGVIPCENEDWSRNGPDEIKIKRWF